MSRIEPGSVDYFNDRDETVVVPAIRRLVRAFRERSLPVIYVCWEGDLILGLESSAIGTLVERTTRFTMLLHLPRMQGHGTQPRAKNGPALTGHGAEAVRDAIATSITTLPEQLRRSLTWDQGAEMAQHAQLRVDADIASTRCSLDWPRAPPVPASPGS